MCLFARSVRPDSGLTTVMWPIVFQSTEVLKDLEFLTGNRDDPSFTKSLIISIVDLLNGIKLLIQACRRITLPLSRIYPVYM